jgi:predicted small lipoprotein YifL
MNRRAVFLALVIGLALVACGGSAPGDLPPDPNGGPASVDTTQEEPPATDEASQINITTDKEAYRAGESIIVTIDNNSTGPIQYMDLCSLHLCQRSGEEWICEEKECDASMTVLESGSRLEIGMDAGSIILAKHLAETILRYRLDYQIVSEGPLYFADSNEFIVKEPGCEQARQIALDYAQSSPYWNMIDVSRVAVRWQDDDQACVVDFAWQGTDEVRPGLWAEGYYVVVGARSGNVKEAHAYER